MMLTLENLTEYVPEYLDLMIKAVYLQTPDGLDWYYHRASFQPDTMKICYDRDNVIRMFHQDAQRLWPVGLSVTEVSADSVPDSLDIHGGWLYDNGEIKPVPVDHVAEAEKRRELEMGVVSARITVLSAAQDDGDITADEEAELATLRTRRSFLRRLDLSSAPDIDWQEGADVA